MLTRLLKKLSGLFALWRKPQAKLVRGSHMDNSDLNDLLSRIRSMPATAVVEPVNTPRAFIDHIQKTTFDRSSVRPWEEETLAPYLKSCFFEDFADIPDPELEAKAFPDPSPHPDRRTCDTCGAQEVRWNRSSIFTCRECSEKRMVRVSEYSRSYGINQPFP